MKAEHFGYLGDGGREGGKEGGRERCERLSPFAGIKTTGRERGEQKQPE